MATKKSKMVAYVKEACENSSVGYSQANRLRNPDVDCSSLMYLAAKAAGYSITNIGWTGSMVTDFKKAGFTVVKFDGNLSDLEAGDIMLNTQYHTEMYIGSGKFGGAHIDENGDIVGKKGGDQTGNEVSICNAYIPSYGWDYVLIPPSESKTTAKKTTKTTTKKTSNATITKLAKEVIAGKYGNGAARKKALGSNYAAVQKKVNELLSK